MTKADKCRRGPVFFNKKCPIHRAVTWTNANGNTTLAIAIKNQDRDAANDPTACIARAPGLLAREVVGQNHRRLKSLHTIRWLPSSRNFSCMSESVVFSFPAFPIEVAVAKLSGKGGLPPPLRIPRRRSETTFLQGASQLDCGGKPPSHLH